MPCTVFCQAGRARSRFSRSRTKGSGRGTSTCPVRVFANPVALEVDFLAVGPGAVGWYEYMPCAVFCQSRPARSGFSHSRARGSGGGYEYMPCGVFLPI